ncbi:MAG: acyl--CoA ligase, partial [Thermoguttaceae bacterium]|nr:acyl--CoA ligase [Thermoguttaceae bacterium]
MTALNQDHPKTYDSSPIRRQFEAEFDFLNVFERNARRFANKPALSDPPTGRVWTYAELNAEANRLANAFYADGVRKGDVVSVGLYNGAEFVFAYIASQKIGAIFNPLNYNWSPNEIAYAFDDSRPKIFVFDAEMESVVAKALQTAAFPPSKTVRVGVPESVQIECVAFDDYVAPLGCDAPSKPEGVSIFDEIARLYTSGTTGRSKGVPINRMNEVMSAHEVAMRYPIFSDDVT